MEHEAAGLARSSHPTIVDPALPPAREPEPTRPTPPSPPPAPRVRRPTAALSDEVLAARQRRQARHARELSSLLNERAELRGVYAPADLVAEALSWSA